MPRAPMITHLCQLLLVLAVLAGLAGCDNNPHPRALRTTDDDGSPWAVRYQFIPDDPRSLDPQFAYDQMSRRVLEPVLDCLVEYHPWKTDPYEVVPCLLETMPERTIHADGSVSYVCKLKRGVMWHDDPCFTSGKGREVVAKDVELAWKRIADPKVECPIFQVFADNVRGYAEAREVAEKNGRALDYDRSIPGFEVLDSHTFRVNLIRPYPQIVYWMGMHFTSPVPWEALAYYDGKEHPDGPNGETVLRPEFRWHPVGNGPFRIQEYDRAARIRLVKNPAYTTSRFPSDNFPPERGERVKALAGKQLPLVDEVEIKIIRETQTMWLLAQLGYFDATSVAKDAFGRIVTANQQLSPDLQAKGMSMEKDVEPSTFFISFNVEDPVLSNKKVRQALALSFNRQKYVDIFFNGVALPAQQLVPPGLFGHRKERRDPNGFNVELARQRMAEAGYANGIDPKTGKPLVFRTEVTATGSEERQMAEFQKQQFEQLGVKIEISENTFAQMLEKEDNGHYQIAPSTGWGADFPDPENFFFLFYSKNIPPVGKNVSRFKHPEFDRLYEQMAAMDNGPERQTVVDKMQAILDEEVPAAMDFHKAYYVVVQPWAPRNHACMMLEGGIKYAVVDTPLRDRLRAEWNRPRLGPLALLVGLVVAAGIYAWNWNRKNNA